MGIEVDNLTVEFELQDQRILAVKDVSFQINKGEILAIVGESGSGKSVSCMAIMGLLPSYSKVEGKITLDGEKVDVDNIRKFRGQKISMVFQEPSAVLNPLMTVGEQIMEAVLAHNDIPKNKAKEIAIKSMQDARIPEPQKKFNQYPHELSGGLKQRVVIAAAIANKPDYILADEPTTALDVTTSSQILKLLTALRDEYNVGIALVTHDFGVVAQIADRVLVMYRGEVMEESDVYSLFENPKNDYTKKLLSSRLRIPHKSA